VGRRLSGWLEWGIDPFWAGLITLTAYVADIVVIVQFGVHQDAIERAVRGAIGSVGWFVLGWGLLVPMVIFLFPWIGPVLLYSRLTKGKSGL
jgi:hypothetical protein